MWPKRYLMCMPHEVMNLDHDVMNLPNEALNLDHEPHHDLGITMSYHANIVSHIMPNHAGANFQA